MKLDNLDFNGESSLSMGTIDRRISVISHYGVTSGALKRREINNIENCGELKHQGYSTDVASI